MVRIHLPEAYFWILVWFIVALLLLVATTILSPQPAIANFVQTMFAGFP